MIIGAAQVLSLNPGTSRSGITMTAGRFLGLSRDAAARASFLMSLPITGGAVAYKLAKLAKDGIPDGLGTPMVAGIIASGISGWLAVWGTLKLIRTRSFAPVRDLPRGRWIHGADRGGGGLALSATAAKRC